MVIPLKIICYRCGAQYPKEFYSQKYGARLFDTSPIAREIRESNWFITDNHDFFCPVCNKVKHDPNAWCDRGTELLNLGCYEEALWAVDKALKLDTYNSYALRLKNDVLIKVLQEYYKTGENPKSEHKWKIWHAYNKYLELWPDDYFFWRPKSEALYNLSQHQEALGEIEKVIDLNPDDSEAWREKARLLNNLGRYEEALQAIDKAIELSPNDFSGWRIKAVVLDEALAAIDNFITDSDNSNARRKRDILREEAVRTIDKVNELNPGDFDAWRDRARVLNNTGRYEQALKEIDKYLKIYPDDSDAWNTKAVALSNLNRNEESLKAIDKAIELSPNDPNAWQGKAFVLVDLKRYKEAGLAQKKASELKIKSK